VERGPVPGWSWHCRYDSLRLHTTRAQSSLPELPLSDSVLRYPGREDVVAYLLHYAKHFNLDVRCGEEAIAISPIDDGFLVRTQVSRYFARHVVVATGEHHSPVRPRWPGWGDFRGEILHSSDYRSGRPFAGRRVLVVGLGNTGADILADLWQCGARPALSLRGPVFVVPLDIAGVNWFRWQRALVEPALSLATRLRRMRLGLVARSAEAVTARIGAWAQASCGGMLEARGVRLKSSPEILEHWRAGRPPLTAGSGIDLLRRGQVAVFPEPCELGVEDVLFSDGRRATFDALVLATGYRPAFEQFLPPDLSADAAGRIHVLGKNALLGSIRRSAPLLARRIAESLVGSETKRRPRRLRIEKDVEKDVEKDGVELADGR
jgi:cation diffusion facilitator CzcD-associated flavoprotein CzcO